MLMTVNDALKLAINALQKEYRYVLFANGSDVYLPDIKLTDIKEAIKVIFSMIIEGS